MAKLTLKKLEEAKVKIRELKGKLFKTLDYEDVDIIKRRIMQVIKEL